MPAPDLALAPNPSARARHGAAAVPQDGLADWQVALLLGGAAVASLTTALAALAGLSAIL